MRSEKEIQRAIDLYADTIKKLCMVHLKNEADTEDVFQIVFLKYFQNDIEFENANHEKAWIIRVTINSCKDLIKSFFRSKTISIEDYLNQQLDVDTSLEDRLILQTVLSLPEKYKIVVYLYYYEGYTAVEIGNILNKNINTVYTLLSRSKKLLKERLGGENIE